MKPGGSCKDFFYKINDEIKVCGKYDAKLWRNFGKYIYECIVSCKSDLIKTKIYVYEVSVTFQ